MAMRLVVHASHPQKRVLARTLDILQRDGVIVYPTDSCYALGCRVGAKMAEDRIRTIRGVSKAHQFTLVCKDLSILGVYAKVSNPAYRLVRMLTPGPYTFILPATKETPRRLQDPRRKTIGLRIPEHPFVDELFALTDEPMLSSTVMNDALRLPYSDAEEIEVALGHAVDAVIDAGPLGIEGTTIIDLTGEVPLLLRPGKGDISRVPDLQAPVT